MPLINLSPKVIADSDIPAAIARDAEVASAIAEHVATPNPHFNNWGGQATHLFYDSVDFNDPTLPLGWIWIRAGGTTVNGFVPGGAPASSACFLLSLRLGSDMQISGGDAHKLQIAFPFNDGYGQCWIRKCQYNIWQAWQRV